MLLVVVVVCVVYLLVSSSLLDCFVCSVVSLSVDDVFGVLLNLQSI